MRKLKDQIIQSQSAKQMMSYILPMYDNDEYMLHVFEAIGKEIDELITWVTDFENQPYPQFATFTLPYWEESLGLEVDRRLSIEQRRSRIITKLSTYFPITRYRLERIASAIAGVPVVVEDFTGPYTFNILLNGFGAINFRELLREVNEIKPAHLSFTVTQMMKAGFYLPTTTLTGEEVTIYPWTPRQIETRSRTKYASAAQSVETISIYPERSGEIG